MLKRKIAILLAAVLVLGTTPVLAADDTAAASAVSGAAEAPAATQAPEPPAEEPAPSTVTEAPAPVPAAPASTPAPAPARLPNTDAAGLVKGLAGDGTWITLALGDVVMNDYLIVSGFTFNGGALSRKLCLYEQDAAGAVTREYTLTVPVMFVGSPNFRIQEGKVIGDITVNASGFNLLNTEVTGNITFRTQAQMDSASVDPALVSGVISVSPVTPAPMPEVPAVTSAPDPEVVPEPSGELSLGDFPDAAAAANADELAAGLSADGTWIILALADVTAGSLTVDGTFLHGEEVARELALYSQGEDGSVTDEYTLTVDALTVNSPGFCIVNGAVIGDIVVNAEGFELDQTAITGNVIFTTQAFMDSAVVDPALVSGTVGLAAEVSVEAPPATEAPAEEAPAEEVPAPSDTVITFDDLLTMLNLEVVDIVPDGSNIILSVLTPDGIAGTITINYGEQTATIDDDITFGIIITDDMVYVDLVVLSEALAEYNSSGAEAPAAEEAPATEEAPVTEAPPAE